MAEQFIRYVPAMDARTRKHPWPKIEFPIELEPPRDLGRFNCRGDYILPDGKRIPAEVIRERYDRSTD